MVIYYAMYLVEYRPGIILFDPLHYLLPAPTNVSNLIFIATYSSALIVTIDNLWCGLNQFNKLCLGYAMLLYLRSASMVLVPLDPPVGLIPLIDPFVSSFNPEPFVATRDLFFSGHCSALALFFFMAKKKTVKYFLAALNLFVIGALSIQRVHYTIDIVSGIIVAYSVYRFMENVFANHLLPFMQKRSQLSLRFHKNPLIKK